MLLLLLSLVALPRAAHGAEPKQAEPRFRFDFKSSVETCPTGEQLRALIVARLGFDPFSSNAGAEIRIAFGRNDAQLEARIQRYDESVLRGERTLYDPSDCSELAAATALAASILIDPSGALAIKHARRTQPPLKTTPVPAEDPFRSEPTSRPAPLPPEERWQAFATSTVIGSVGFAPGPALGFSLGAGLRWRRLVLRLEGRADLPVRSDALADGSHAKSSVLLGSFLPCLAQDPFELCGVVSAGAFMARSENITPSERGQTVVLASGLRTVFNLQVVGPLHLSAHLEALAPVEAGVAQCARGGGVVVTAVGVFSGIWRDGTLFVMDFARGSESTERLPRTTELRKGKPPPTWLENTFRADAPFVANSLRRFGVQPTDIPDQLQEVFLTVHKISHKYDRSRPLRPWLYGIAYRVAGRYRRGGRDGASEPVESLALIDPGPLADSALETKQAQALVLAALERVALSRRAVMILADIEGETVPTIAEALEIPLNTAYSRLRLARKEFAKAIHQLNSRGVRPR